MILDGRLVSGAILDDLQNRIANLKVTTQKSPGLAVILVGNNPASQAYVNSKKKACEKIGVTSFEYLLEETVSEAELGALITRLNADDRVNGILLQLPLPKGLNEEKLLYMIDPEKDVDGFHPSNIGRVLLGLPGLKPCTPYGVCELLRFYKIETRGKHVVILGRSNIVGKPLAAMLMQRGDGADAVVTVCHSAVEDVSYYTKQADIVIAALGKPEFLTADQVSDNVVVIDVGINRVKDSTSPRGYKLVGDVAYEEVAAKASAITPVPGGVGLMTIAMLMKNTLTAFCHAEGIV